MSFSIRFPGRSFLLFLVLGLVVVFGFGCARKISSEEKQLRVDLLQATREHANAQVSEIARHILREAPRDNNVWARLVQAHLSQQDITGANQALTDWRGAVRKNTPKRHELTGDVAMHLADPSAAVEAWSKARSANARNTRVLKKLARGYRALWQWSEEDAALTAILALEENANARLRRALCRRQQHRWSEALTDMRRAQQLAPEDAEVRKSGQLFDRLEKFLAPIRELDARIALTPEDDQLVTDRALLFLRSDDPELTEQDAEAAAKIAPWAVRPKLFQAIALQHLGRDDELERLGVPERLPLEALTSEFLETIARLDSEISVERNNAELYVARAWQLNDLGQPTLALHDVEVALEKNADSAGAHTEASYALAKLGRAEEAYARIKQATDLDPQYSTAWDYRAALEMARSDFTAAIESLTRALAITATRDALQKREECYVKLGLLQKAKDDRRALETLK